MLADFTTIPIEQAMCHWAAYDLMALWGSRICDRWDLIDFEKEAVSFEGGRYAHDEWRFEELREKLATLNQSMPFLKFKECGVRHGYELFLSQPCGWCLSGAPLFWAYAARAFTYDVLPMDPDALKVKYLGIAASFGIPLQGEDSVYVERFASGGMSSGMVNGIFVEESTKTLLRRNKLYGSKN